MRRPSLSPPRAGVTHSRYSPSWTRTVSPGLARAAARLMVRRGELSEPSPRSEPVVATWCTVMAAPSGDLEHEHAPGRRWELGVQDGPVDRRRRVGLRG